MNEPEKKSWHVGNVKSSGCNVRQYDLRHTHLLIGMVRCEALKLLKG